MKALLTGSTGFVGGGLLKAYPEWIPAPSLREADEDFIRALMDKIRPDVIIHTAAVSDIGACEMDPEASYAANVLLPVLLAKARGTSRLICFSSDQVYSGSGGEGPYTETDAMPSNTYARQKLEMEKRVLDLSPDAVMLRAEWMYDYPAARSNYLSIILEQEQVGFSTTQFRGVTWLREVAAAMPAAVKLPGGVYNFGSETDESMYEITRAFAAYLGKKLQVEDTPGRHNLWMDCGKAKAFGVCFSTVLDALRECADVYHLRKTGEREHKEGAENADSE